MLIRGDSRWLFKILITTTNIYTKRDISKNRNRSIYVLGVDNPDFAAKYSFQISLILAKIQLELERLETDH